MTELTVSIVTYNSAEVIEKCLGSVLASWPKNELKVLVWDNVSDDQTREIIRGKFPTVKVCSSPRNIGFGAGHNFLLNEAKGEFFLCLNPDARLTEGCAEQLARVLSENPRIGAIAPSLIFPDGRFQISWGKFPSLKNEYLTRGDYWKVNSFRKDELAELKKKYQKEGYIDWVSGACFLARTDVLRKIGGFDPNFFLYFEDADLDLRLALAGYSCYHLPSAKVEHISAGSLRNSPWTKEIRYRESQLYYYFKWKSPRELKLIKFYLRMKFLWKRLKLTLSGNLSNDARVFFQELYRLLRQNSYPVGRGHKRPAARRTNTLTRILDRSGGLIYRSFAALFPKSEQRVTGPKNILFIKLCCLGDVLFTTPTLRAFRRRFPQAKLTYLTGSWCQKVAGWVRDLDEVKVFEDAFSKAGFLDKYFRAWKILRVLRKEKYDAVVSFHRDARASFLAWLINAGCRIGFTQSGAGYLYTNTARFEQGLHEVKRYLKLAEAIGIESESHELRIMTDRCQASTEIMLKGDAVPVICIAPGGGKNPGTFMPIKRWPYYSELVRRLKSELECRIILAGDKYDAEAGEKIERENSSGLENLIGKTDLEQLVPILLECSLFIGNDSGTLYLAAALGIPTVGIYGPSDPDRVAPLNSLHTSVKRGLYCSPCYRPDTVYGQKYFDCWTGTFECMKKLEVAEVMQAVRRQLENITPVRG
jgi:lipopolysaccharide heptosyltransferase II